MSLFSINVSGESVAASTAETILQGVASASKSVELVRWGISFAGTSVTDTPVLVELLRLTSAGTSSAFTPIKLNPQGDSALMTARTSHTAEPVAGEVIEKHYVTPAGGNLVMQYAPDERVWVAPSGRLGLRVLANDSVNVSAFLIFDE